MVLGVSRERSGVPGDRTCRVGNFGGRACDLSCVNCKACHEIISAVMDDACSQLEAGMARRHVASCWACRQWITEIVDLHDRLVAAGFERTPPDLARRRLARLVHPAGRRAGPAPSPPAVRELASVIPLRSSSPAP